MQSFLHNSYSLMMLQILTNSLLPFPLLLHNHHMLLLNNLIFLLDFQFQLGNGTLMLFDSLIQVTYGLVVRLTDLLCLVVECVIDCALLE